MTGRQAGEPRYAVKRQRVEVGDGLVHDLWHVVDLVKDRVVDSFQTWGMARTTADALNAGRKLPALTANEVWAGWA